MLNIPWLRVPEHHLTYQINLWAPKISSYFKNNFQILCFFSLCSTKRDNGEPRACHSLLFDQIVFHNFSFIHSHQYYEYLYLYVDSVDPRFLVVKCKVYRLSRIVSDQGLLPRLVFGLTNYFWVLSKSGFLFPIWIEVIQLCDLEHFCVTWIEPLPFNCISHFSKLENILVLFLCLRISSNGYTIKPLWWGHLVPKKESNRK